MKTDIFYQVPHCWTDVHTQLNVIVYIFSVLPVKENFVLHLTQISKTSVFI